MDAPFLKIRNICKSLGIYNLNYLAVLEMVKPGMTATKIASTLGISTTAVTMILDILEVVSGVVTKTRNTSEGSDRRKCALAVTDAGEDLLKTLNEILK